MDERDAFLNSTMPRLRAAETALHNGDAAPRAAIWSHNDPVTVFGAGASAIGWAKIGAAFDFLATRLSNCTSWEYEVTAADASGDLAYVVGIEHTTASFAGAEAESYALRVTTIFRREDGEWKVVHRHADPVPGTGPAPMMRPSERDQLARVTEDRH